MQAKYFLTLLTYIIMSVMVIIPSGSFFLPQYLAYTLESNQYTENELLYALKLSLPTAYQQKIKDVQQGSSEWIIYTKLLAKTDARYALQLASFYQIEEEYEQSITWYKQAIALKQPKALIKLSELYISLGEYDEAKNILIQIQHEASVTEMLFYIAVTQGDIQFIEKNITHLNNNVDNSFIEKLIKYKVIKPPLLKENTLKNNIDFHFNESNMHACKNSIQLLATTIENLNKLTVLINKVKGHPLADLFCFNTPRYIPITTLNCTTKKDKPIQCNEFVFGDITPEIDTRYIGLMLEQGGANVNNGILYMDELDDVDVFTHELAHLIGFIDEYELPYNHTVCKSSQTYPFSHNIAVIPEYYEGEKSNVLNQVLKQIPWAKHINSETPIIHQVGNKWKVGTPLSYKPTSQHFSSNNTIGLYHANTCNKQETIAFKAVNIITQLHYYEEEFPEFYAKIVHQEATRFLMPSYHYNIAKELIKIGKDEKSMYWLKKALKREEKESHRYKKIIRGEY